MKAMQAETVHEIDPEKVRVFVHRERDPVEFQRSVEDTKRRGQIEPGEVRDIRNLPKEERQRPGGGYYDFALVVGEGRLLRAKALGRKFKAFIVERNEVQTVGRFLSENLNRVSLPWTQKARLVKPLLEDGISPEEIATRLSLSPSHVVKFRRILDKTATGLESEVEEMSMNDAEAFTALPKEHQAIVIEAFKEKAASPSIRELVKKAKAVSEQQGGQLSSVALRQSLQRVDDDLKRTREKLKLTRLHWSLGPQNLQTMLKNPKFRAAVEKAGVNLVKFEKEMSEA